MPVSAGTGFFPMRLTGDSPTGCAVESALTFSSFSPTFLLVSLPFPHGKHGLRKTDKTNVTAAKSATGWSHPFPLPLYFLQNYLPTNFTSPRRGAHIFRGWASEDGVMRVEILSAFSSAAPPSWLLSQWRPKRRRTILGGKYVFFSLPIIPYNLGIFWISFFLHTLMFPRPAASLSQRRPDGTCRQKTVWLNVYENLLWLVFDLWSTKEAKGGVCSVSRYYKRTNRGKINCDGLYLFVKQCLLLAKRTKHAGGRQGNEK